jgi:MinD-like ATPase involved in chromosome partitioning or flagellar assembly
MGKVSILAIMTITLVARKGGVGKSTLALLLHESFRQARKTVAIRDWDVQGTSNKSLELIGGQKAQGEASYDILIYDTPPNLEHAATAIAVQQAHIVLVVTSPSPADLWEARQTAEFVQEKNSAAAVRLVFNKVRKGTVLGRVIEESAQRVGVPTLGSSLSYRECFQHALGQGWKALDGAAREEVLHLTVALFNLYR